MGLLTLPRLLLTAAFLLACPALPAVQLVVFEGCGHMPQEECPDRFVQTVQQFVASLDQ